MLLRGHGVTAAILETARGGLLTKGLFMRRGKVGALLNVGSEHIGVDGIDSLDAMARHKSQVVIGSRVAVLNADDPRCASLANVCGSSRVILFSTRVDNPEVVSVLNAGGKAVHLDREGWMVFSAGEGGGRSERVVRIADIPITLGGAATHYCADALAASAVSIGLGVPLPVIASALTNFSGGMAENPGRWTVLEGYPFTLVAERGLNPAAFPWTAKTVCSLPVKGRRILLLSAIGNRSNSQYDELTALAAPAFDRFVVYDNFAYLRGRSAGEVPALLKSGLLKYGVPRERVEIAASLEAGMELASAIVQPGDLVLILTNQLSQKENELRQAFARHRRS
jgi:cyanophycin synthetase